MVLAVVARSLSIGGSARLDVQDKALHELADLGELNTGDPDTLLAELAAIPLPPGCAPVSSRRRAGTSSRRARDNAEALTAPEGARHGQIGRAI